MAARIHTARGRTTRGTNYRKRSVELRQHMVMSTRGRVILHQLPWPRRHLAVDPPLSQTLRDVAVQHGVFNAQGHTRAHRECKVYRARRFRTSARTLRSARPATSFVANLAGEADNTDSMLAHSTLAFGLTDPPAASKGPAVACEPARGLNHGVLPLQDGNSVFGGR